MKAASWIAGFLTCAVLLLMPLAYATPTDPSWISGFWDDGDYDDVVCLVASSAGTTSVHGGHAAPSTIVVGPLIERDRGRRLAPRSSAAPTRAPPTA